MDATGFVTAIRSSLRDTARAYSALFFLDSPGAGALLMLGTFVYPNVGAAGLLAALVGLVVARLFRFPDGQNSIYILNSMLVGLSLGAFYQLDLRIAVLIAAGAALALFLTAALADLFWRQEKLPVLVLPFILVAAIASLVARQLVDAALYSGYLLPSPGWVAPAANEFLSLLGATFFTVHPLAGAVVLGVMLWRSRYMALLAVAAVLVGEAVLVLLQVDRTSTLTTWTGFNLVLTAIAVGGIYTVPGLASFATAMLAVVFAALLIVAFQDLLYVYGLPVIALPYMMATLVALMALRTRLTVAPPWLVTQSGMPEQNFERARLARVRNGDVDSVPLLLPVVGRWQVYQGFDGEHTHRPPWQHALDLYITEDGRSFSGDGLALEEFYCFGLPVLSPVHGQVARVRDHLADNAPGDVDAKNNWGNFVLVRLESGLHVLLAHLRQNSVKVKEGEWVQPGKPLAGVGNSGRSPQPHLHLQVQSGAQLGSPTRPFHLCSLLRYRDGERGEYRVTLRPGRGDSIGAAVVDPRLAQPLHLPVGRELTYSFEAPGQSGAATRSLRVELALLGQFRLVSDSGASAAFEETNGVLAFFDRQGPRDDFLDTWLLACGLTPLSESAHHWQDSPSALLLPLGPARRALLGTVHPLGRGLESTYTRQFDVGEGTWRQRGEHEIGAGGRLWRATTEGLLDPEAGFRAIDCVFGADRWSARLTELGLAGDEGIPGWQLSQRSGDTVRERPS